MGFGQKYQRYIARLILIDYGSNEWKGSFQYEAEYANLYFLRLLALKTPTTEAAHRKWIQPDQASSLSASSSDSTTTGPIMFAPKVTNIVPGQRCAVVGTVYCDKAHKPNVLDDLSQELWLMAPPARDSYCSPDDAYYLEDESSRITLTGEIVRSASLVTGAVVAVLGMENLAGEFEVQDLCFPGLAPQPSALPELAEDQYVALVSGLNLAEGNPVSLPMEMLAEYLAGHLGAEGDQEINSSIVRLVILGNSLNSTTSLTEKCQSLFLNGLSPLENLDTLLSDFCSAMPTTIQPGERDPVNHVVPQQPLHTSLFPQASKLSSFQSVSNPSWINVGDISSSGQTISDACKYTESTSALEMAELTLRWRHIAPSAPDTLWCYPFVDNDPFVLKSTPHLYCIGNQSEFDSKLIKGSEGQVCRIVCVPDFSKTQTIVLINLRNLATHPISFAVNF
ncbi:DNA polymerase alpha/epsilon subunit B-domain-containing protein [Dimargaris cristalligena]|uniref:DNA polymerase alpha/epsilon subunit B-domain-containing protein n=1 Tax=Dimargaris cristalligena TaxID=215637 RepID=A0A4Q0A157_9FUNG|nr:DNA polymerase alpha/epsilon subunit B-domain-containing protein [Dimargaris cristalligena]|eukprot:RKP39181.1 DNA polymerase alpha/epsilon subunit B-domain-containing protein [Dimargaris cristalligena]